jgi:hypothetical protein
VRRNEEHKRQLEIEKKEMQERIAKYVQEEEEEFIKTYTKNKSFQDDLIGQIDYDMKKKDRVSILCFKISFQKFLKLKFKTLKQRWLDYNEYQSCVRAEEEYQKRLAENMKSMKIDNIHPIHQSNLPDNTTRGGSFN